MRTIQIGGLGFATRRRFTNNIGKKGLSRQLSFATEPRTLSRFANALTQAFYMTGLLFAMGGFVLQLGGADLTVASVAGKGSLLSQSVLGTVYLGGLACLFRTGIATKILTRAWPVFLLPTLAIVSAVWSPDPMLTLRRAFALLGTVLFGLSLAASFDFRTCLSLLIRALAIAMLLSVIWVVAFPEYGLHQASDAVQSVHAGKWRGIFAHKNSLGGGLAGLTLALLLMFGRYAFKSFILRMAAIIVTLLCLVGADSATGYAIAFVTTLLGASLSIIAMQPVHMRLPMLVFTFGILLLALPFGDYILGMTLDALGKEPDLTGRTEYWRMILPVMHDHWTLGYGYFTGYLSIEPTITDKYAIKFGSTHNGYLDIIVSFGLIGVIITIGYLLWQIGKSLTFSLFGPAELGSLTAFPICVVVYALQHNFVESSLLAGNTIVPLVLAIAAGMLVRVDVEIIMQRSYNRQRPSAS